jgi:hypothetical protein
MLQAGEKHEMPPDAGERLAKVAKQRTGRSD